MDDLRQQIHQLQQRLHLYENHDHDENEGFEDDGIDVNPFHQTRSHVSDDSTPSHPRDLRHYVLRDRETHHAFNAKVEIPEFEGKMQPDEFIEWLNTVDRIFEYQEVPEHRKVKLVAIKLRKHASFWWENLKKQRDREGRSKILTWIKMKKELTRKYLPDNYRQDIFLKIQNFRQKDLSIAEYTAEFDNLMLKGDLMEPEQQTIARYLGGLNYEISNVVQLQPYWTFNDVCKLAFKVEKQQKEIRGRSSKYGSREGFPIKGTNSKCFKCQGFGHIASECPNRRIVSLVEEENEEEMEEDSKADDYNDQEEGEEVTYADHELKLGSEVYVFIMVEENEGDNEPPVIMKSILDKFHDVVPEEIPPGLPPMRDIQHYIDFVPGAALPNKA
ncbi:hypothetical protein LWI29_026225 [Acer saccharum]|uniref:CCHC-type domain-containing protein n=1 Tax=Acer saccharum TaxID=4024 RepID=A0AA39SDC3_ACESA|nr:hypothetical protein LWI29_026225 [Acer saccharum]